MPRSTKLLRRLDRRDGDGGDEKLVAVEVGVTL
jgi:hypothetical protein